MLGGQRDSDESTLPIALLIYTTHFDFQEKIVTPELYSGLSLSSKKTLIFDLKKISHPINAQDYLVMLSSKKTLR